MNTVNVLLKGKDQEINVTFVDVPGAKVVRDTNELKKAKVVLFTVDSFNFYADKTALVLYELLSNRYIIENRVPVLVVCNKSDIMMTSKLYIRRQLEKEMLGLWMARKNETMDTITDEGEEVTQTLLLRSLDDVFSFDTTCQNSVECIEISAKEGKNLEDLKKTHALMGWDLLMNEHRRLKVDGEEIGVLGIENWGAGRFPKFGKMDEAVKNTDDLPIKLLLSHDPSHWRAEILEKYPQIDMSFAGHTHGAQFGIESEYLKWSPVQYIYEEWDGLYQEGHQQLYVNVGYGFLGYPGRVGLLPEITIFTLSRA